MQSGLLVRARYISLSFAGKDMLQASTYETRPVHSTQKHIMSSTYCTIWLVRLSCAPTLIKLRGTDVRACNDGLGGGACCRDSIDTSQDLSSQGGVIEFVGV